jgi:hypothetical protein
LLLAAMDQPVQKCSGGDDDGPRANGAAVAQLDAADNTLFAIRCSLFARRKSKSAVSS